MQREIDSDNSNNNSNINLKIFKTLNGTLSPDLLKQLMMSSVGRP
jgi:hypothetical protein